MSNISKTTLGSLGKISMCKRVLKHQTSEIGEIPFYKISTFGGVPSTFISDELYQSFSKKYSYPKIGDILISAAGTIGKTVIFDGKPSYFQDSNIVWIANDEKKILNIFLYYYYQSEPWIATNGSTIKRLYNDNIRNLKITYPEKSVQKQIAKVLSDLDKKIEINNKINQELEAMAKTLYDYWFVQFDFPVALATSSELDSEPLSIENSKPYKSSGGKLVFNAALNREIPIGWEVKEIESCADFKNGKGIKKDLVSNNGKFPVYGSNGIVGETDNFLFEKPVIAIGRVGANYGEVHYSITPCWITDNAVTSQPKYKEYLWWLLLTLKKINYSTIAGGSAQPLITQGKLKALSFPIPTDSLFEQFHKIVNPIYMKINNVLEQNQKLSELRDWLLPMLMNGQITVGGAEKAVSSLRGTKQSYNENAKNSLGLVAEEGEKYNS